MCMNFYLSGAEDHSMLKEDGTGKLEKKSFGILSAATLEIRFL